jgi:hypothetical protein
MAGFKEKVKENFVSIHKNKEIVRCFKSVNFSADDESVFPIMGDTYLYIHTRYYGYINVRKAIAKSIMNRILEFPLLMNSWVFSNLFGESRSRILCAKSWGLANRTCSVGHDE